MHVGSPEDYTKHGVRMDRCEACGGAFIRCTVSSNHVTCRHLLDAFGRAASILNTTACYRIDSAARCTHGCTVYIWTPFEQPPQPLVVTLARLSTSARASQPFVARLVALARLATLARIGRARLPHRHRRWAYEQHATLQRRARAGRLARRKKWCAAAVDAACARRLVGAVARCGMVHGGGVAHAESPCRAL